MLELWNSKLTDFWHKSSVVDPDPKFKVHFGSFLDPGCIYKDVEQYSVIKFEHWETSRNFEKLRVCQAKEQRIFEKINIFSYIT